MGPEHQPDAARKFDTLEPSASVTISDQRDQHFPQCHRAGRHYVLSPQQTLIPPSGNQLLKPAVAESGCQVRFFVSFCQCQTTVTSVILIWVQSVAGESEYYPF